MKKTQKWMAGVLTGAVLTAGFCIWQNNDLTVSRSQLVSEQVPDGFDGYTIVQISDLHNKEFGEGQCRILSKLAELKPDLIVITGDMIDSRRTDVEAALDFARQAADMAPCYYVSGNHESRVPEDYEQLKAGLDEGGVTVLESESVVLEQDGAEITLMGVQDPAFGAVGSTLDEEILLDERTIMESQLAKLTAAVETAGGSSFTVLLSHRPELLDVYAAVGVDLVFTGHAHGGQWRLPRLGGLIAPGQGFFPKYTSGAHTVQSDDGGTTTMYISRGLGNSLMPIRIFNRPEIVVVELCRR